MLAEILKKSFDKYFKAPIEAWKEFAEFCEPVSFDKDQIIKSQGTTEDDRHITAHKTFVLTHCTSSLSSI